ncbi:hemolysin family protein [bacterium]|nr:hemolysin family protein [bacterium]
MSRTVFALLLTVFFASTTLAAPVAGGVEVAGDPTRADTILLIAYILLALVISFLCSISEAALLSVTPAYIEGQREKRPQLAKLLRKLKQENVDQSLAAILTLNTIAHTVGAIGAGAKATVVFGSTWFGLFSAIMTLLILFLSEIIPKTLGALYWARLIRPVAAFVQMLIVALYPLVWISERLTRAFSRGREVHLFSRDEFLAMARIGEQTGRLDDNEFRMIRNLFRFAVLNATDILTPRTVMSAFPESMTIAQAAMLVTEIPFSRLPLFDRDIDQVTGFALRDDILMKAAQGEGDLPLVEIRRPIHVVPETITLSKLFEDLIRLGEHVAVVIDEHGGTSGLVTLEDLIETLMGLEIMDETDTVKDMRSAARKKWEERLRRQPK